MLAAKINGTSVKPLSTYIKDTIGTTAWTPLGPQQGHHWDHSEDTIGTTARTPLGPQQGHHWDHSKDNIGNLSVVRLNRLLD